MKFLRPVFGEIALSDIIAEAIEDYLAEYMTASEQMKIEFAAPNICATLL